MPYDLKSLRNAKGFTLIEAMISLFLISIGLMAITRMQIGSINGNASAMNTLQAAVESTAQSELIQSMNINNLVDGSTITTTSPNGNYTTTYTVNNVTLYSGQVYRSFVMNTTWTDARGNAKNIQSTITKLQ